MSSSPGSEPVLDGEVLYRSVPIGRNRLVPLQGGGCRPSSMAFADRDQQISVDRAVLRESNPSLSQMADTDGVLALTAAEVRAIPKVGQKGLVADVEPAPLEENPSHAHIQLSPELGNPTNFKKLLESLVRICESDHWAIEPNACT